MTHLEEEKNLNFCGLPLAERMGSRRKEDKEVQRETLLLELYFGVTFFELQY